MKRTRRSERIEREARDRLTDSFSDLPDCVLLHIMKFMNAKDAVQTCLLSKRWKDLWKRLTNLTFDSSDFSRLPFFSQFVSSVLSYRDDSISLHNLDLRRKGRSDTNLLNGVLTYAASHDVQQLMINVNLTLEKDFEIPSCVLHCRSLTCLKLSFWPLCNPVKKIKFPKSLELPALKSLHISNVTFATSDNGCAEPFSTCNILDILVIERCYLQSDAKVLCISNSKLSNLTIMIYSLWQNDFLIMLSAPNLSVLTIRGDPIYQLSSVCNLPFLKEVNIQLSSFFKDFLRYGLVMISWLQVFVNVKILTLSGLTPAIFYAVLSHGLIRTQPPCFVRLESLKLKMERRANISDEGISKMVDYLLQKSSLTGVDILKC